MRLLILGSVIMLLSGCDPEHRKRCEWYLIPEPESTISIAPGFIPVCARNFVTNKQDCRMQATLEFAQNIYNKKFKHSEIKTDGPGIPRTIESIPLCE